MQFDACAHVFTCINTPMDESENNLELDVWHAEWIEWLTFRLEYYILGFLEY